MGQPLTAGLRPAARELVLAAHRGELVAFGTNYARVLDDPDLDQITRDLLELLGQLVTGWLPSPADPAAAIESVHHAVRGTYPRCLRLLAINQVVLEQLARSVIGLSGLLASLDATEACLYAALLTGCSLTEPAELDALAGRLARASDG